jgi:hypothetical protein
MTTIIRICLDLIFVLIAIAVTVFIVSLLSVFTVSLLIAVSVYFFLARKYALINHRN